MMGAGRLHQSLLVILLVQLCSSLVDADRLTQEVADSDMSIVMITSTMSMSLSMSLGKGSAKKTKGSKSIKAKKVKGCKTSKKHHGKASASSLPELCSPTSSSGPQTPSASVTSEPTSTSNMVKVGLTPYKISYDLDLFRIPLPTDYDEVTQVTSDYLDKYFGDQFSSSSTMQYAFSSTSRDGEQYTSANDPLVVFYSTSVSFESSAGVPAATELDVLLGSALVSDAYIAALETLPVSNLFQSTTSTSFETAPKDDSDGGNFMSAAVVSGIAVAAGAGAFIVVAAGMALLRQGDGGGAGEKDDHDVVKYIGEGGDVTVAGETYAGASTDSESVQPTNWRKNVPYNTSFYRTHSVTETVDELNDSDDCEMDSPPPSPGQMESVDL